MDYRTLDGIALDALVHRALGGDPIKDGCTPPPYSSDWSFGGPIIEDAAITLNIVENGLMGAIEWGAECGQGHYWASTPLVAAMRCYVASRLIDDCLDPDHAGCYDCQPMPSNPSIND